MQKRHYKLGAFHRVAEHLFCYSVTKKYYAVFKCNGKTRWISLKTTDRELAGRRVKEEIAKQNECLCGCFKPVVIDGPTRSQVAITWTLNPIGNWH